MSQRGESNARNDIHGRLASGGAAAFGPGWEPVSESETIGGTGWIAGVAEGMNLVEEFAELR